MRSAVALERELQHQTAREQLKTRIAEKIRRQMSSLVGKTSIIHEMIYKFYNEDQDFAFLLHILDCEDQPLNL